MTILTRPARPDDLDALIALEARAFAPTDRFARRNLRRLLASPSADLLLALRAGIPVGAAILLFRSGSHLARLYSLARDPAAAGQGVGPALLDAAAATSRHRNCDRLRLEVRESNTAAIGLYERSGFRLRETKKAYYADGEAARIYERPLDGANDPK